MINSESVKYRLIYIVGFIVPMILNVSCNEVDKTEKYPYLTTFTDLAGLACNENEDIKYGDENVADSVKQKLESQMYQMFIQNDFSDYIGSVCCSDFCSAINAATLAELGLTDSAISSVRHINSCEWNVHSEENLELFRYPPEMSFFETWALYRVLLKVQGLNSLEGMSSTYFDLLYSIPHHDIILLDHYYYTNYFNGGIGPNLLDTVEKFKKLYKGWTALEYYRLNFISEILQDTSVFDSILYFEALVGNRQLLLNVNQLYGGSLGKISYDPPFIENMTDFQLIRNLYYSTYFNNAAVKNNHDVAVIEIINFLFSNPHLSTDWPKTANWLLGFTNRRLLSERIAQFEKSFSYKLLPQLKKRIFNELKTTVLNSDAVGG